MHCRCPACGHTTQIQLEVGDFFTRCDYCCTLLKPTLLPEEAKVLIQPMHVGRFRVESSRDAGIAELLCPPQNPPRVRREGVSGAPETPSAASVVVSSMGAGEMTPSEATAVLAGPGAVELPPADDMGQLAAVISAHCQRPRVRRQRHALLGVTVVGSLLVVALALIGGTIAIAKASGLFVARPTEATTPTSAPAPKFVDLDGAPSNPELYPAVPEKADR